MAPGALRAQRAATEAVKAERSVGATTVAAWRESAGRHRVRDSSLRVTLRAWSSRSDAIGTVTFQDRDDSCDALPSFPSLKSRYTPTWEDCGGRVMLSASPLDLLSHAPPGLGCVTPSFLSRLRIASAANALVLLR